jgi:hypothetical protein
LVQGLVQEALEAEMATLLGAAKGERTADRRGYRSGYYERGLVTRVGKLELRVPQDRDGRFSTELDTSINGVAGGCERELRPGDTGMAVCRSALVNG